MPRKPTHPVSKRPSRAKAPPTHDPQLDLTDAGLGRVEIRREAARLMATCGMSSSMAVEAIMRRFALQERQAWRYVQAVREAWAKVEQEERPGHRAWLLQVQTAVLVEAREERDHRAANGAVRNLTDLLGLKVSKVELQEGGLDALVAALQKTPAQREDEIARLEEKARAAGLDPDALAVPDEPG